MHFSIDRCGRKGERGFTLVEILAAAAISMILLSSIYIAIHSAQRSSAGMERKVTTQQDARAGLELMVMEIRMASFNPTCASGIWLGADQRYKGIQTATDSRIQVEMDLNQNSTIGDANENITYNYEPSPNQRITRDTGGGPQPFLGDLPTRSSSRRVLRVVNDTLNVPIFSYFDGRGNLIPAANLPGAIPEIRMIGITLCVETNEIDPSTGRPWSMVYSSRLIPRNHAY